MRRIINDEGLDTLFRAARGHGPWLDRPVSDTLLRALWELVKHGPVGGDAGPNRIVFIKSPEAKAVLAAALSAEHRAAVAAISVAAVVAGAANGDRDEPALRDGFLRAGYLILAARALGLDCEPVWGYDRARLDAVLFPEGDLTALFLCALGYGDETQSSSNETQAGFDEACRIL